MIPRNLPLYFKTIDIFKIHKRIRCFRSYCDAFLNFISIFLIIGYMLGIYFHIIVNNRLYVTYSHIIVNNINMSIICRYNIIVLFYDKIEKAKGVNNKKNVGNKKIENSILVYAEMNQVCIWNLMSI